MRFLSFIVLGALCLSPLKAEEVPAAKAKAQALLHLETSARERGPVLHDLAQARVYAAESGSPLVIWVGKAPKDAVEKMPEAIHCEVSSYAESALPRVIVPTQYGYYWQIEGPNPPNVVERIRRALAPPESSRVRPAFSRVVC